MILITIKVVLPPKKYFGTPRIQKWLESKMAAIPIMQILMKIHNFTAKVIVNTIEQDI